MTIKIEINGLELPLNDAHVHQRRGVTAARTESGEPLHFTVLRCLDGRHKKSYCGLARADNVEDFKRILLWGDKFEPIAARFREVS
ncbi:hypothetical protein D9H04_07925 [Escherichia coli]|nr:hypothetical protein [Escherichia coli]EEW2469479.1 hypothetical protein [Escherichia coli]EGI4643102.1 hypothetical protein [Escherichia coli]MGR07705.1 hypothetical protein [Escherichia coli]MHT44888.1 hypothetical protein [Escherichia coli]